MSTKRSYHKFNPSTLMQDSDWLTIPQAAEWVEKWYHLKVCQKTMYNWINIGRIGSHGMRRRLYKYVLCDQLVLKKEWIINFLNEVSRGKRR